MKAKQLRPPLAPFDRDTATKKLRLAEDGWNSRDPEGVSLAYTMKYCDPLTASHQSEHLPPMPPRCVRPLPST